MERCSNCLLPETYPNIEFDSQGKCNYCRSYKAFIPRGEKHLEELFQRASRLKRKYDALVPLSGGKDSVYILYLAKKIYKLNVLTYTFDNGFLSEEAKENIRNALNSADVEHILIKHDWDLMRRLYRAALLKSGDLCSVCGLGIAMNFYKLSSDFGIPLILRGKSVIEENSYTPENIYDTRRFKKIMSESSDIRESDVHQLLIYPKWNLSYRVLWTMLGKVGRLVSPLYYLDIKSESDIKEIIQKEMQWKDPFSSGLSKHFDCIASPFSNDVREKRFGYSRKVCHLSNMIRRGEITRDQAIRNLVGGNHEEQSFHIERILKMLDLSEEELKNIVSIKPGKYEKYTYLSDKALRSLKAFLGR